MKVIIMRIMWFETTYYENTNTSTNHHRNIVLYIVFYIINTICFIEFIVISII